MQTDSVHFSDILWLFSMGTFLRSCQLVKSIELVHLVTGRGGYQSHKRIWSFTFLHFAITLLICCATSSSIHLQSNVSCVQLFQMMRHLMAGILYIRNCCKLQIYKCKELTSIEIVSCKPAHTGTHTFQYDPFNAFLFSFT